MESTVLPIVYSSLAHLSVKLPRYLDSVRETKSEFGDVFLFRRHPAISKIYFFALRLTRPGFSFIRLHRTTC